MLFRFSEKNVPHWFYEALPYLYVAAGLIASLSLSNYTGIASGVLLMIAGVLVLLMRRKHRKHLKWIEENQIAAVEPLRPTSRVVWQTAYELGHEVIDKQHRRLFIQVNELAQAVKDSQKYEDIELLLGQLVDDIDRHFKTEEEVMAQANQPLSEKHRHLHQMLLSGARSYRDRYHNHLVNPGEMVDFLADEVIAKHIATEDQKLQRFTRQS